MTVFHLIVCGLVLLKYAHTASVLYSTRFTDNQVTCSGNATDGLCFEKLFVPERTEQSLSGRPYLYNVYSTYDVCKCKFNEIYFDNLAVPPRMQQNGVRITCIDYFTNYSLAMNISSGSNWMVLHFDINNYCLYCNHSTRKNFISAINTTAMPYYWRREPAVCNNNPVLMAYIYAPYFARLKSVNSNLSKLSSPPGDLGDFLNYTYARTITLDYVNENQRDDLFYLCAFMETKMYAFVDDIWEREIIPFRYQGIWIIDIVLRVIIVACFIFLLWIPRIKYWIQKYKSMTVSLTKKEWLLQAVSALHAQAMIADTISAILWSFEDYTYLDTTARAYRSGAGIFRLASMMMISFSTFLIIVSWAHVLHAFDAMNTQQVLSPRFIVAAAVVYVFHIVFGLVGGIAFLAVGSSLKYYTAAICVLIGVALILTVITGFIFYGFRILWVLRASKTPIELLQLRVTRLVLMSNFCWSFIVVWLVILAVSYLAPTSLYLFFNVYVYQFVDLSGYLAYAMHIVMFFRHDQFHSCYFAWRQKKEPPAPIKTIHVTSEEIMMTPVTPITPSFPILDSN